MSTPVYIDNAPGGLQLSGDYTKDFLLTGHESRERCDQHGDDPFCPFRTLD